MTRELKIVRTREPQTEEIKPQIQEKPRKLKKKNRAKELMEEFEKKNTEVKDGGRVIVRDKKEQDLLELKSKKSSGEIFSVSIGDILRAKLKEQEKQNSEEKEEVG